MTPSRPTRTSEHRAPEPVRVDRTTATIRVDAAGQIVGWDAGARQVYGLAEDDVLGVTLRDLTLEMTGAITETEARGERNEAVARSEARFRALVQHSSDLVGIVDRHLTITFVSPSSIELLGVPPAATVGRQVTTVVHEGDRDHLHLHLAGLLDASAPGRPRFDVRLRHADGEWRTFEMVATDLLADPAVGGIVINGRDVTDRRRGDLELRHRLTHDPLTDLANRTFFLDQLAALLLPGEPGHGTIAVVAVGLDRLKTINDSLGHHAGDQVLVTTGERLRRALPDGGILARVGGDTFVAASPVCSPEEGRPLAERLLATLQEPVHVAGRRIAFAARAGVALSGPDSTAATLLRNADAAMHRAKGIRTDPVAVFEPTIGDQADRRLELEQALHDAVDNQELRVHLQPIVTTHDGRPIGVEALVRWEHPSLGLIPPLDFIPLAEETGDIIAIGRWVLREACEIVAAWNRTGRPLQLSVNLSARQFDDPNLVDDLRATLTETGFDPRALTLEVTESVLVDEGDAVGTSLAELHDLGVRLAIDDFGTGYSSLVYLRRLRVDALKIDKSFIDGLAVDTDDDTIVRTIIDLASSLGLGVVAEGVETEEQRERLVLHGCPQAQGYLFARPLEPDALMAHYATSAPASAFGPGAEGAGGV